ncbi:MAG TPA: NAD-dependent epimerase/dehydratase family protein [Polyangia bacterium]|nr:NAD-dependent epimerase/dehydratase family protein [Polyangia bacterium]
MTGAAGLIGSHVVDGLLARGHQVVALDDLSGGWRGNVDARATFVPGSILDVELIGRLFDEHRFAYVFHLAAYAAEGLSHFIKRFNYQNNLIGSVNLINASINHPVRCFVFASSIAVYGHGAPPVTEETPPAPADPYGIGKWAVEQELRVSRQVFGLRSIVFRPHNVYGERQNIGDRYRNVVGIFMNQILRGEPLTIFGDGTQTRAFSHVSDVAPVMVEAIERPEAYDETFNIGADRSCSVNQLGEIVSRAMGVAFRPAYLPARFEAAHAQASHAKARALLQYRDAVRLEDGVSAMAAWAKQVGPREGPRFGALEIERNLPPAWREPASSTVKPGR